MFKSKMFKSKFLNRFYAFVYYECIFENKRVNMFHNTNIQEIKMPDSFQFVFPYSLTTTYCLIKLVFVLCFLFSFSYRCWGSVSSMKRCIPCGGKGYVLGEREWFQEMIFCSKRQSAEIRQNLYANIRQIADHVRHILPHMWKYQAI